MRMVSSNVSMLAKGFFLKLLNFVSHKPDVSFIFDVERLSQTLGLGFRFCFATALRNWQMLSEHHKRELISPVTAVNALGKNTIVIEEHNNTDFAERRLANLCIRSLLASSCNEKIVEDESAGKAALGSVQSQSGSKVGETKKRFGTEPQWLFSCKTQFFRVAKNTSENGLFTFEGAVIYICCCASKY